jgi:hypothetical protein
MTTENELYEFLVSDYFATGEGRTTFVLITRAYPQSEDYAEDMTVITTRAERAEREFREEFGGYFAQGARNISREEFLQYYSIHIPPWLERQLREQPEPEPGNLHFTQRIHLNFG